MESAAFTRRMARKLCEMADGEGFQFVFKASYDKANRTSGASFRGPGLEEGCRLLADFETPLSAYQKLRDQGQSFLLESV
ncbi:MAG: hypothetical protein N2322_05140, partial [Terrimicrobiaceae bacterium]|nr:hypothetical protein [Terrimicrobiaceae bacterium]